MTEEVIGHGFGGFPLYKVAKRVYRCRDCGHEIITETNHKTDCYPICKGSCRQIISDGKTYESVLRKQTTHKYVKEATQ